jgi:hypothetical protein
MAVLTEHDPEQFEVSEERTLVSVAPELEYPEREEIRMRAYELWCERGCPHGSADLDWHQAEHELRARRDLKR